MAIQTATNPQTGERIALINGQWVPFTQSATNAQGQRAFFVGNQWFYPELVSPAAPKEESGFLRQAADIPVGIARGAVQGVRMIADAFGAGSDVSRTIKGAEEYLGGLLSAQAKNDEQAIAKIMQDAEDKGMGDQVKAALRAFMTAPVDLLSQGLGTAAPVVLSVLGAKILGAGAVVTKGIGLGLGAGMGAGVVKGTIYEETKKALIEAGMGSDQAEARAQLAQSYGGKNLDMILGGAALGGLAATTGIEKALTGPLARGILTRAGIKETAEEAAQGLGRRVATGALAEAVPEFLQASQEQLAQNIALQREGFDVPTMRGVVGAGALEGLVGAGLGAGFGAIPSGTSAVTPPPPPREEPLETIPEVATLPPTPEVAPRITERDIASAGVDVPAGAIPFVRRMVLGKTREEIGELVAQRPELIQGEAPTARIIRSILGSQPAVDQRSTEPGVGLPSGVTGRPDAAVPAAAPAVEPLERDGVAPSEPPVGVQPELTRPITPSVTEIPRGPQAPQAVETEAQRPQVPAEVDVQVPTEAVATPRTEGGLPVTGTTAESVEAAGPSLKSSWDSMPVADRETMALLAGIRQIPATNASRKTWDALTEPQRKKLAEVMEVEPTPVATLPEATAEQDRQPLPEPDVDEEQKAVENLERQRRRAKAVSPNLRTALLGSLPPDEVRDISPDFSMRPLQAQQGKAATSISTKVADGALNEFLPFNLRFGDGYTTDPTLTGDAVEYIKDKLRNKQHYTYETDVAVEQIGLQIAEIERAMREHLNLRETNLMIQEAIDEQRRIDEEAEVAAPEAEARTPATAPRVAEEEITAEEEARLEREAIQAESREAEERLSPTTPAALKAAEERAKKAEKEAEQARKDADKAEAEAKKELERREIAERSEGAARDFQLGQNAEDNLTGQRNIFGEQQQQAGIGRLGFFSALSQAVDGLSAKTMPAAGWKDAIKGLVNKGQVKQDEVEWTGLNDWLDLQTGRVTKQQVMDYLDANGVQVEEVVLGANSAAASQERAEEIGSRLDELGWEIDSDQDTGTVFRFTNKESGDEILPDDIPTSASEEYQLMREAVVLGGTLDNASKYSNYTLPGGTNYREVLLTLPVKKLPETSQATFADLQRLDPKLAEDFNESLSWYADRRLTSDELDIELRNAIFGGGVGSKMEEAGRIRALFPDGVVKAQSFKTALSERYKSRHWDQFNVIAHIRVNDRTDADGDRVLFVEEIQSDWGQEGKKKGFAKDVDVSGKIRDLTAEDKARLGIDYGVLMLNGDTWGYMPSRAEAEAYLKERSAVNGIPTAPFVTKTEGWLNLALKRVITMAAEGGYDKVAFTDAEPHYKRWGTERIDWAKQPDGSFLVKAKSQEGGDAAGIDLEAEAVARGLSKSNSKVVRSVNELADTIRPALTEGQNAEDLAPKIWQRMQEENSGTAMPRREGFEAFYGDKQGMNPKTGAPSFLLGSLKKLLPKVGGGKVGAVSINPEKFSVRATDVDGDFWVRDNATGAEVFFGSRPEAEAVAAQRNGAQAQPGFTITPAMREKVTEGIPLFQRTAQGGWSIDPDEQRVEKELTGKSFTQLMQWAVDNAPDAYQKEIAQKVQNKLKAMQKRGVEMTFDLQTGMNRLLKMSNSRGILAWTASQDKPVSLTLTLNGAASIENQSGYPPGMRHATVLHELIHAATVLDLALNKNSLPAKALNDLRNKVVDYFNDRVKNGTLTDFEQKIYDRTNNALTSTDEVLAWGLTDADMQTFLADVKIGERTLWDRFVDIVRNILGMDRPYKSALEELLRTADSLLDISVDETAKAVTEKGYQFGPATPTLSATAAPMTQGTLFERSEDQINTPAFKRWSRNAPLVLAADALSYNFQDGKPFVAESYHGTNAEEDFTEFDMDLGGNMTAAESAGMGFFSTSETEVAGSYAKNLGMGRSIGLALMGATDLKSDPEAISLQKAVDDAGKASSKAYYDAVSEIVDQERKPGSMFGLVNFGDEEARRIANQILSIEKYPGNAARLARIESANQAVEDARRALSQYVYDYESTKIPQRIMPLYVRMANPKVYDAGGKTPAEFALSDRIAAAKEAGHDGVVFKNIADPAPVAVHYVSFSNADLKSAIGNRGTYGETGNILEQRAAEQQQAALGRQANIERTPGELARRNVFMDSVEATWESPVDPRPLGISDYLIYQLQNKQIDLKRVQDAIGNLGYNADGYLKESLYHGRAAKRTEQFLEKGLDPILEAMRKNGITQEQIGEYLHNRHAPEANAHIAERNERFPDGGSGITNAEAQAYMDGLEPARKRQFEQVASLIDKSIRDMQDILVESGNEEASTIQTWREMFQYYIPLVREDADYSVNKAMSQGSGYSMSGKFSKARTGSTKEVKQSELLAAIAEQHERAIVRAERNRVGQAIFAMALQNPNPSFYLALDPETNPIWRQLKEIRELQADRNFMQEIIDSGTLSPDLRAAYEMEIDLLDEMIKKARVPALRAEEQARKDLQSMGLDPELVNNIMMPPMKARYDANKNEVVYEPQAAFANDHVFTTRVNGKDKFVLFNANNERASRMVKSIKSMDAEPLSQAMNIAARITRYFAAINTQYNPVFGVYNFLRDMQAAMLQISDTPIAGKRAAVMGNTMPAMRAIFEATRGKRSKKDLSKSDREMVKLWDEFTDRGGQTGFRDLFSQTSERADAIQRMIDPSSWANSPMGKFFTANGTLKAPFETARKGLAPVFDLLSDYNTTMENAVRLAAYKVAKEQFISEGMGKEEAMDRAASIGKELTVNFNRKGALSTQVGALYAFFNAAVQGTTRMAQTLTGPAGKTIVGGAFLLGALQAVMLAAAGFDDEEPPEFVKQRNYVIPIGDGKYLAFPMPLGFNVLPTVSRIVTEGVLSGGENIPDKIVNLLDAVMDMYNPIGNAGMSMQTVAPTLLDPAVALFENKDWTGKKISREDFSGIDPTPGYTRSKDASTFLSKELARFLNFATGGTGARPGVISPTADQLDYLVGQLTGGVGRETMKLGKTIEAQITGEELPFYSVPLFGRFYGNVNEMAAISNAFYRNLTDLNIHRREVDNLRKDRGNVQEYISKNPEARMSQIAGTQYREIQKMRKTRLELLERGEKEKAKRLEEQIKTRMVRFNEKYRELKDKE